MKRILVTGANGFIGSFMMSTLKQNGFDPLGAIRSSDANLATCTGSDYVCVGEIGPATDWSDALTGIDAVVHLAARVHVLQDVSFDPIEAYRRVNVEGTSSLAAQAIKMGVKRFIYVSSIKVNGEQTSDCPFTEESIPEPADPYGQSKLESELLLQELTHNSTLELVIVRPPLVYGPGVGGNFRRLIELVERGFPLPLASVHNARSMVSLKNLTDFLMTCVVHPGAAGETFLVSDGVDWSTPDLIAAIAKTLGVSERLFPFSLPLLRLIGRLSGQNDAINRLCQSLVVDISRSRDYLSWKPQQSPQDAVRQTVDWFLRHKNA